MRRRSRRRKVLVVSLVVLLALLAAGGVSAYSFLTQNKPVVYANIVEQYKYGSLGTEQLSGIPYEIWAVLPDVFPDLLPPGQGKAYKRFGFLFEPGHTRPIGTTFREKPVGLVGLNCAVCHTGTYRATATSPRQIVLGMPANRFRFDSYLNFLREVGRDKRFNADTLLAAINRRFPGRLSFLDRTFWRYAVIPETKKGLQRVDRNFRWLDGRPPYGPGRVDTFNPLKQRADFDMNADHTVGTVDFPSIWDQRQHRGMHLHWDGNNNSLLERNLSAARAVGGTDDSLDIHQLDRVANWLLDLRPPAFPRARIDTSLASLGKAIYDQQCAAQARLFAAAERTARIDAAAHVIAETIGSLKSVPLSTAWRKINANATYERRCSHCHRPLFRRRLRNAVTVTRISRSTDSAPRPIASVP